jgi:hypothetical protein
VTAPLVENNGSPAKVTAGTPRRHLRAAERNGDEQEGGKDEKIRFISSVLPGLPGFL